MPDLNFEHRLTEVEQRSKSNTHRIDEVEQEVKTLTDKPGKRWEKLMEVLLTVIVGALVGFIFAKIGL